MNHNGTAGEAPLAVIGSLPSRHCTMTVMSNAVSFPVMGSQERP